jgi:tRNA (guanine26-N2/guanine27-N2)-dimethyltransferase
MIEEGKAKIIVREGVFYNPEAKLSRDIGVAFLDSIFKKMNRKLRICEPLSATGVRGIRYVLETEAVEKILLNDKLKVAYENILENIKINGLENIAEAENKDANLLLEEHAYKGKRFDFIDVDPFGSPIYYIQPALRSLAHKGYLAIAATDTAALYGVARRACLRRYFAHPLKNEFSKEIGVRILIAACIRIASANELALEPVFAHATKHYLRVYFRMYVSVSKVDPILAKIGYVEYCQNCLWRKNIFDFKEINKICENCGEKTQIAGPLWLGEIYDKEIVENMKNKEISFEARELIEFIEQEIEKPPFFYTLDSLASKLKTNEPKIGDVIVKLKEMGFLVGRTHFYSKGIKTNAQISDLIKIFKELSNKVA